MAIAEVTVIPIGTATTSLSQYVADIQNLLSEISGKKSIHYQMTPMSTIIEGELDDVLGAIRAIHELPFTKGAERVSTSIKIDDRRDQASSMSQKMSSVARKLSRDE